MNVAKAVKRGDGKWNCQAVVPARQGYGYYACGNSAIHDPDADGNPTKCGTHSSAAIMRDAERKKATNLKWKAEFDRKQAIRKAEAAILPALRQIADGYNDPRGLATEVVSALDAALAKT